MSIAAKIRYMYDNGQMTNSPEDKKRVAAMFGITIQTVHATLKNHLGLRKSITELPMNSIHNIRMDSYSEIKELINKRYDECYDIARSKGIDLPKIEVCFNLKGTVAGMFCTRFGKKFFRVNLILAFENIENYLKQIIPHEFSHYIVNHSFSLNNPSPHGIQWKKTMRFIFGLNPERCHNYDTTNVKRNVKTYMYKCLCRQIEISSIRHRRIQTNQKNYICKICHQRIEFVN
jgi:SprT protein